MTLKVWTCDDHRGRWPGGVASVVVAETEEAARRFLQAALFKKGLWKSPEDDFTLTPLDLETPAAIIIRDGDY